MIHLRAQEHILDHFACPGAYLEQFWAATKSAGAGTGRDMPMMVSRGCPYQAGYPLSIFPYPPNREAGNSQEHLGVPPQPAHQSRENETRIFTVGGKARKTFVKECLEKCLVFWVLRPIHFHDVFFNFGTVIEFHNKHQ